MKKLIACILALACVLSLCACSSNKGHSSNPTSANNSNAANNSSSAQKGTVSLNDYIVMTTRHHEKYGSADFHYDIESLIKDNCDEKGVEKINKTFDRNYDTVEEAAWRIAAMDDSKLRPTYTFTTENLHLSNGDVIHVSWENVDTDYINKLQSCLGTKITYSDFDLTVTGLEPIMPFDLFANAEMHSNDISGSGHYPECIVKVPLRKYENGEVVYSTYDVSLNPVSYDRDGQLSNGDVVRYQVDSVLAQLMEAYCGYIPEQTEGDIVLNCFQ